MITRPVSPFWPVAVAGLALTGLVSAAGLDPIGIVPLAVGAAAAIVAGARGRGAATVTAAAALAHLAERAHPAPWLVLATTALLVLYLLLVQLAEAGASHVPRLRAHALAALAAMCAACVVLLVLAIFTRSVTPGAVFAFAGIAALIWLLLLATTGRCGARR